MTDFQGLRFSEPLPRRTTEHKTREPVEVNEAPSVKQLDGEVTKEGEIAFGEGAYCEVWKGRWKKGGGEEIGEIVSFSLTTSILLTWLFVGGLESTSDTQCNRGGAEGPTFADRLHTTSSCHLPGY